MLIETGSSTIDLQTGGFAFYESKKGKNGTIREWSELTPEAQEKLERIQAEVEALVDEGKRLIRR